MKFLMRLLVVNIVVLIRLHTSRLIRNSCDKMFVNSCFRGEVYDEARCTFCLENLVFI